MRMSRAVALGVLVVMSLTAASFGAAPDPTTAQLSKLNGQAFDVAFMQALIPMNDEAAEIAMAATLNADHTELLQWNQTFIEQEKARVRQMLTWLEGAGSKPTQRNEGVATAAVRQMRTLRGPALEKTYLSLMASRLDHSTALARLATQKASQPALRSFAGEVVRIDSQESSMLRGWLKRWY